MALKEFSLVTVATVAAVDPALYRPPKSGQTGKAVIVANTPAALKGEFAGHAGEYAEWNTGAWIFRKPANFPGVTVFDESAGAIYFIGPAGLIGPIGGGQTYPPPPTSPDGQYVLSCFVVGATQEFVWVSMG